MSKVWMISFLLCVVSGPGFCAVSDKDYKQLRCEHYIVYYHKDVEERYARRIKDIAEEFYRKITQEFNLVRDKLWLWDGRAKIYIAKDTREYQDKFNCPPWSGACVDYHGKRIFTYPHQKEFKIILIHELTHIIFREYAGYKHLPLWLDEAMATYMEDKWGGGHYAKRLGLVKKYIKDNSYVPFLQLNRINQRQLNALDPKAVNVFYLQSFSIVHFLIKRWGRDNFSHFLFYLRNGNDLTSSIRKAFSLIRNMEDLEKAWKKYYQK